MTDAEWETALTKACAGAVGGEHMRKQLIQLLNKYRDVFTPQVNCLRPMDAPMVKIYTTNVAPLRARGRRYYSAEQQHFLNSEVQRLVHLGVLEESTSDYDAPPVVVAKASGGFRMCNDYRLLNQHTEAQDATIPTIDDVLRELAGSLVFSKLDCTAGYFQLIIDPADRAKTAFRCQLGTFHYRVAPFGLRNLPAAFNSALARLLHDLWEIVQHYFDDLLVHTKTPEDHLIALERLLLRCREKSIQLSITKSSFCQTTLEILGYKVSGDNFAIPARALAAVRALQPPRSKKQLMKILGLTGYYRQFIPEYTRKSLPLLQLLPLDALWVWTREQQEAFDSLVSAITSDPVLQLPRRPGQVGFSTFVVACDASDHAVAAVLSQRSVTDGQLHPCMFFSRKLHAAEINYTTSEKECLAAVAAVAHWRVYLVDAPFIVATDHKALTFLMSARELAGRLARWSLQLQQYNFTIIHRKGAENVEADALSRLHRGDQTYEDDMSEELQHVAQEVCPSDMDATPSGPSRPQQTQKRGQLSVLVITRTQRRNGIDPGLVAAPASANDVSATLATMAQRQTEEQEHGNNKHIPTATGVNTTAPDAEKTRWPKTLVWHEEPWLSTALQYRLRTNKLPEGLPTRIAQRVEQDAEVYTMTFATGKPSPLSIGRWVETDNGLSGDKRKWLAVPPPSQRLSIVEEAHDLGHLGLEKTIHRIRTAGWTWTGMHQDVQALIDRCAACQRDAAYRLYHHPAQPIPIPCGVFERVHMDILELPLSREGYRYVLLFVDALSKFPIAFPQKKKDMHTVAANLWNLITIFGPPVILFSDNGTEFLNKAVLELQQLYGISRRLITAYRPQANGLVERYNRALLAILRKVSGDTPDMWADWLDYAMLAIRTATNASTGFSPFRVMFGREFHPLANYAIFDWAALYDDMATANGGVESMVQRIVWMKSALEREEREAARVSATGAGIAQAGQTDKHHRIQESRLPEGTVVFIKTQHRQHKLQHRFEGPYIVDLTVGGGEAGAAHAPHGGNYKLKDPRSGQRLAQSYPRDMVFEVPQPHVQLSLRQAAVFTVGELEAAAREVAIIRPGPFSNEASQRWRGQYCWEHGASSRSESGKGASWSRAHVCRRGDPRCTQRQAKERSWTGGYRRDLGEVGWVRRM
jgi:hypothetical protein